MYQYYNMYFPAKNETMILFSRKNIHVRESGWMLFLCPCLHITALPSHKRGNFF